MAITNIIYFPAEGDKYSPVDLFKTLCDVRGKVHFTEKLEMLRELGTSHWHFKWLEHFDDIYQVTQGNFRLYFKIINGMMIVCHVCRKVSRKAKPEDLHRAKLNLQQYEGK